MGNKRFDYVRDISRHRAAMKVKCPCGHQAVISAHIFFFVKPSNMPIETYAARLICSHCGTKRFRWHLVPEGLD